MQKSVKAVRILCLVLAVMFVFSVSSAMAWDSSDVISGGQTKTWLMDPGDTLTVYYRPDGNSRTLIWYHDLHYWWKRDSATAIEIYAIYGGTSYLLRRCSIDILAQSQDLLLGKGLYRFYIKNHKEGDIITLKLK